MVMAASPSDVALVPGETWRQGITKASFDALETVCFRAARPDECDLRASSITELKQLMRSHGVDGTGAIEKAHLVDALLEHFLISPLARSERTKCIDSPLQCAICMIDFNDSEMLLRLPCYDAHIFHNACIQQWLDKHSQCPLCRAEVGEKELLYASPREPIHLLSSEPEHAESLLRELGLTLFNADGSIDGAGRLPFTSVVVGGDFLVYGSAHADGVGWEVWRGGGWADSDGEDRRDSRLRMDSMRARAIMSDLDHAFGSHASSPLPSARSTPRSAACSSASFSSPRRRDAPSRPRGVGVVPTRVDDSRANARCGGGCRSAGLPPLLPTAQRTRHSHAAAPSPREAPGRGAASPSRRPHMSAASSSHLPSRAVRPSATAEAVGGSAARPARAAAHSSPDAAARRGRPARANRPAAGPSFARQRQPNARLATSQTQESRTTASVPRLPRASGQRSSAHAGRRADSRGRPWRLRT